MDSFIPQIYYFVLEYQQIHFISHYKQYSLIQTVLFGTGVEGDIEITHNRS